LVLGIGWPIDGRPQTVPVKPAFRDCDDCPLMIRLPAGGFLMGSPDGEADRDTDETPLHRVEFAGDVAIGAGPVTLREFRAFVVATGHRTEGDWQAAFGATHRQADDEPVVRVGYEDAQAYAAWLAQRTGRPYRLPTEAEWEYGARGGTATRFFWGDAMDPDHANGGQSVCCHGATAGRDRWLYTSPIGSFPPNGFGLFDMAGNVFQWVADCDRDTYPDRPVDKTADDPACPYRVLRGGSWVRPHRDLRAAARAALRPETRSPEIGFRVAVSTGFD
jgi:formylglycine-generating enzyme required for sulfatase activity